MAARIRALDWARTPLGPIETWSERLRLAAEMMLATPLVSSLVCGPERILIYNDAAARLYGARHPDALGRSLAASAPDEWAVVEGFYERAFAGEAVEVEGQPLDVGGHGDPEATVFDAYLTPAREADGRVACVHMTGFEIGRRHRAERALQESEKRQAFLLMLSDALRPLVDPVVIQDTAARILGQHLGVDRTYYVAIDEARQVATVEREYRRGEIPSLIGTHAFAAYGATLDLLRAGRPVIVDDVETAPGIRTADLPVHRALGLRAFLNAPLLKGGRLVCAMCVVSVEPRHWTTAEAALVTSLAERTWDAVERASAEAAVRLSEERLQLALNATELAVYEWDLVSDRVTANERFKEMVGVGPDKPFVGARVLEHGVHPDDRARVEGDLAHAMRGASTGRFTFEHRLGRPGQRWVFSHGQVYFDESHGDRRPIRVFGTLSDITDRKRAEANAALLAGIADDLSRLSTPDEIVEAVGVRLAEALNLNLCLFADVDEARDDVTVQHSWERHGLPSLKQRFRIGDFLTDEFARSQRAGETFVVRDTVTDERTDAEAYASLSIAAILAVPFHRGGRWVAYLTVTDATPRDWRIDEIVVVREVAERVFPRIERARAEAALRESEERQAFLLKLSDALRPLSDPAAIQKAAMKLLAEKHDVMRAGYMDVLADGDTLTMAAKFELEVVPLPPQIRLSDYGPDIADAFRAGRTLCVRDAVAEAETGEQRAAHLAIGVLSWIIAPLVKGGRLIGIVGVVSGTPRDWTPTEIQLVTDLAERTWDAVQRARSEAALRESEERFAQFAASSADALWIRDAATLSMEYVSPAIATIYGVEPDTFLNGVKVWASAILPEDREIALEHLERARHGEAVVHEFRIQRPSDGSFRWIRNTDFPLLDELGRVQRIGGIAQDVTETKLAVEHQAVLLAELQHRVRNIMALIRSITARTGERAESVPEYAALMRGRLTTFARVQALLTRGANVGVAVTEIVRDELAAQAGHEEQYTLDGPAVVLSPKAAEGLTLAVHELTTNALKYGGLSVPEGRVAVRWATFERRGTPWLGLDWVEQGAPARPPADLSAPPRRGFGTELIEGRIPYELGGRGQVVLKPGGARCRLEFPLREGASILETNAPRRSAVFGGAIDMTGEADLTGQRILVVEDDYFQATDTARALRGCGAEVLGPCPTEAAARDRLAEVAPTGAVLDLNLGEGPSFALAAELRARGVPFVMVTGYDEAAIPAEYKVVPRLQKPVELKQVVGALAAALGVAA